MAATTSGALKAYVESLGSGVPVFRDGPRPGQAEPYIVVQEAVSVGLDSRANGDFGDPAAEINITEVATVDLIERARTKTGARTAKNAERYGLAESLAHALHGCRLPAHPAPVHGVRVTGFDRFPISDNRIRTSIPVEIRRGLLPAEVTPA
ncbi:hypothetical protein A6A06_09540 [Streptomyces sp. CB02923]|uniref:hypothetical protein n=1 Tax=Streptomyces sp. CB02923 TaxID=1718985 RepID=UPI00093A862D|nr:hypothetical protein [Streptomyces sp. CB02923]OKI04928.1 hypothetical protein A6A06_09540 [Streptomyces sp. CB02923]